MTLIKRARSEEAKEERRQAFLDAALDEFFERGFTAARMDDIARRAGFSKASLYLYFENKEALFVDLIKSLTAPRIAQIEKVAYEAVSFRDTMHMFAMLGPNLILHSKMPRLMKILIGDCTNFPDVVRLYRTQVFERILGIFSEFLKRAQGRGEIRQTEPELMARLIMAPVALSGVWHILFSDDPDAHVDLSALFRTHADGLIRAYCLEEPQS